MRSAGRHRQLPIALRPGDRGRDGLADRDAALAGLVPRSSTPYQEASFSARVSQIEAVATIRWAASSTTTASTFQRRFAAGARTRSR